MTVIGQRHSICPHCLEGVVLPPANWLPPWVCSSCGGLYGQGKDRLFRVPADFEPIRFLMTFQQAHYWAHFNAGTKPYVYALCYPTGLPFYIGKGTKKRLISHGKFVGERAPQDEKEEVIEQLQQMGLSEYYAVLVLHLTNSQALTEEAKFIIKCGRRSNGGMLTNLDEGNLVREPETWDLPQQPELIPSCVNPNRWVIHPEITCRKPTQSGVAIRCPACDYYCKHPLGVKFEQVRCPHCFHGWSVDPDSVLALYRARLVGTQGPATTRKPKIVKLEESALATQEHPVEDAIAQIVMATIVEPKPRPVIQEEKPSYAIPAFLLGFICALALSICAALALR